MYQDITHFKIQNNQKPELPQSGLRQPRQTFRTIKNQNSENHFNFFRLYHFKNITSKTVLIIEYSFGAIFRVWFYAWPKNFRKGCFSVDSQKGFF